MIRLTIRSQTPKEAALQVDGWVSGKNVTILEQEGTRLFEETQRLVLDLDGVQFIDREGIALLKRWSREGWVLLRGGSLFIQALLEENGLVYAWDAIWCNPVPRI